MHTPCYYEKLDSFGNEVKKKLVRFEGARLQGCARRQMHFQGNGKMKNRVHPVHKRRSCDFVDRGNVLAQTFKKPEV